MTARIMVINDDTEFLGLMQALLAEEGYQVVTLRESRGAARIVRRERPDLVILDIRMEHPEAGSQLLEILRLDPATTALPVIVCSADAVFLRQKDALLREKGCIPLEKPFDLDDLLSAVTSVVGPGGAPAG